MTGTARRIRSLGVVDVGRLGFFELEEPSPREGELWLETMYSGLSAGTELSFLKGTNPYLRSQWDPELCVFREDEPSVSFPVPSLGYMEVGRVTESHTPTFHDGEIIAMAYGHKAAHRARPSSEFMVKVPEDVDPLLAVYLAQMGPICANGLLHAAADVAGSDVRSLGDGVRGRFVLISGAGVVGLLTGLFALCHGAAEVAVADTSSFRLRAAEALGMTPIDTSRTEVWRYCKERWHHDVNDRGADIVFQCRGHAASLHAGLRCARPQGLLVDMAFYQDGASDLRLGEEFHHNGLSIRCAQIQRVPRTVRHLWDRGRLAAETLDLIRAHGDLIAEHLITDVVNIDDAPSAVEQLAQRRREVIQMVFSFESAGARSQ